MAERWTQSDRDLIKRLKDKISAEEIQRKYFPHRTIKAVKMQLMRLYDDQPLSPHTWTQDDITLLRQLKGTMPAREIRRNHFRDCTVKSVETQLAKLNDIPPFHQTSWTAEENQLLDRTYATSTMQQLLQLFPNRTADSIKNQAIRRGLTLDRTKRMERVQISRGTGTNIATLKSTKPNKNNASGTKGVYFDKRRKKFMAAIGFRKHYYHLGRFDTIEEAATARAAAVEALTPELERIEAEIPTKLKELAKRAARDAATKDVPPEPNAAPENTNERT